MKIIIMKVSSEISTDLSGKLYDLNPRYFRPAEVNSLLGDLKSKQRPIVEITARQMN